MTFLQVLVEFAPVPLALTAALLAAVAFIQPRAAFRTERSAAQTETRLSEVLRPPV